MAQSLYPLTAENAVEDFSGVEVRHEPSGFVYVARREGDRFVQEEYRLGEEGVRDHQLAREMTYVVGSGSAARTYLAEEHGRLYELPLTWYTQADGGAGRWGLSPGYAEQNARFDRTIPERCMACHNGTSEPVPFADGKYASLATGIGCESCHGPGALHAEARLGQPEAPDSVDVTIVNPKWLATDLRLDVCQQCHLNGEVSVLREGETAQSYRPGRPLSAHRAIFALVSDDPNRVSVISHADRMRQSACFQESVAMDCVTCHNPHEGFRDKGPEYFNATCQTCHAPDALQAAMPTPAAKAQHAANADCFSCHMPKVEADDVPHASFTDHYVRVVGDDRIVGTATSGELPAVLRGRPRGRGRGGDGLRDLRAAGRRRDGVPTRRVAAGAAARRAPRGGRGPVPPGLRAPPDRPRSAGHRAAPAGAGDRREPRAAQRARPGVRADGACAGRGREALPPAPSRSSPPPPTSASTYGRLLEAQGRLDEAVGQYRAAIDEKPWLAQAHVLLGGALAKNGDLSGAVAALRAGRDAGARTRPTR